MKLSGEDIKCLMTKSSHSIDARLLGNALVRSLIASVHEEERISRLLCEAVRKGDHALVLQYATEFAAARSGCPELESNARVGAVTPPDIESTDPDHRAIPLGSQTIQR